MKILILAAMDKEISLLINLFENYEEILNSGIRCFKGEINNITVIIGKCGIGKVNAAVNAFKLIHSLKPDLLINSGVAGGANLPIGSVLFADKVAYHDVWCGPGTLYGQADSNPLFMIPSLPILDIIKKHIDDWNIETGLICSGDKFISTVNEISFIRDKFPDVKAVDMESAAIAQVSIMTDTPFAIIRVVSDTPGKGENISQYKDFWSTAPQKTFDIVRKLLEEIK